MPTFLRACLLSFGLLACVPLHAQEVESAAPAGSAESDDGSWWSRSWDTVAKAYTEGSPELYVTLVSHHARFAYPREKIDSYEERPFGLGYGHGRYDEKGNWHGVYAMGFEDSHSRPQWVAGYGWKAMWGDRSGWQTGLGFTAGLTAREDIGNYIPFPIMLPLASVSYKKLALEATYIPGGAGAGNVLFVWGKWSFGD